MTTETRVVQTEADMADLWFHLIEDHGASLSMLHGNPFNMHSVVAVFASCGRTYIGPTE